MTDNPANRRMERQNHLWNRDETPHAEMKLGRNNKESKENNHW